MKKLIDFVGILCVAAFVVWLTGCTMFVPETNEYDAEIQEDYYHAIEAQYSNEKPVNTRLFSMKCPDGGCVFEEVVIHNPNVIDNTMKISRAKTRSEVSADTLKVYAAPVERVLSGGLLSYFWNDSLKTVAKNSGNNNTNYDINNVGDDNTNDFTTSRKSSGDNIDYSKVNNSVDNSNNSTDRHDYVTSDRHDYVTSDRHDAVAEPAIVVVPPSYPPAP